MKDIIRKLEQNRDLQDEEFLALLSCTDEETLAFLYQRACAVRERYYGKDVYIRGLIEFSSYCKNDCLYCLLSQS